MGCCGNSEVSPERGSRNNEFNNFDGPVKDRSCKDVFFLVLFLSYLGLMVYITAIAVARGDAYRISNGVDSWGNTCDRHNCPIDGANLSGRDMTGRRYSFYFNPTVLDGGDGQSVIICVTECPTTQVTTVAQMQDLANKGQELCRYDIQSTSYHSGQSDGLGSCPVMPVEAMKVVLGRCVPTTYTNALSALETSFASLLDAIDPNFSEKLVSDLEAAWREIIYLCLVALGLSLAVVILLRFFARIVIWVVTVALALGSVIATIFLWNTYGTKQIALNSNSNPTTAEQDEVTGWLIGAICASVITVILLLILLILRKRIALVAQLFKEAGKAIADIPFLLVQPIWTLIVLSGILAGLIFVFLYIETASTPSIDGTTGHVTFTPDSDLLVLKWFFILGILWITLFIVASQELVVSSAVAMWFFTRDKSKLRIPILTSVYRLVRYHLGSVAFGAMIIALVKLVRLTLSFIEGRLRGNIGCLALFCTKCLACCLWCLEKVLKFLNRNAYVQIGIHGYDFCKAARRAFAVITSNALRVVAINCVGDFVLFLGKVGTVAAVACIGIELLKNRTDINYIWLPILLSCIFAYFISSCFLDVFEMAIDAIFVCFAEDCEMNDGVSRPYFMSIGLMEFVRNSDQAIAIAERKGQGSN